MVTGDRDLFQLVDDARGIRVIYTVRGLVNLDVIDEAAVSAKYDIPGRAYADFAALRGDPSDGLPGVPGMGEKTAAALIRAFGSVEGIITRWTPGTAGFPAAAGRSWRRPAATWTSPCRSSGWRDDAPLPPVDGRLPAVPRDADKLKELGERWGLGSSLSRFVSAVSRS